MGRFDTMRNENITMSIKMMAGFQLRVSAKQMPIQNRALAGMGSQRNEVLRRTSTSNLARRRPPALGKSNAVYAQKQRIIYVSRITFMNSD